MKRRGFLTLLTGAIAAPAIIKVAGIMPIRAPKLVSVGIDFAPVTGNDVTAIAVYDQRHLSGFIQFGGYYPRRMTNSELAKLAEGFA